LSEACKIVAGGRTKNNRCNLRCTCAEQIAYLATRRRLLSKRKLHWNKKIKLRFGFRKQEFGGDLVGGARRGGEKSLRLADQLGRGKTGRVIADWRQTNCPAMQEGVVPRVLLLGARSTWNCFHRRRRRRHLHSGPFITDANAIMQMICLFITEEASRARVLIGPPRGPD
jgi:hypothetical protein